MKVFAKALFLLLSTLGSLMASAAAQLTPLTASAEAEGRGAAQPDPRPTVTLKPFRRKTSFSFPYRDTKFLFGFYFYLQNGANLMFPWQHKKNYFETHPGYFTINDQGQRVSHEQLCFSNPALRKELTALLAS